MKYYKIQFYDSKKEIFTLKAKSASPTSFLGLIEISEIIHKEESSILITPEDDKSRIEFKNVNKTYIPIGSIIRIDEIIEDDKQFLFRLVKDKDEDSE
ncbi:MAG: DUF1820 family protein [Calditerrivibrio sp.]|nr:DUF1820 family protein [Calditerrivibrio sp.]MCA1932040.1 DUF1820 family protein [Calditerrivibrio sp.]